MSTFLTLRSNRFVPTGLLALVAAILLAPVAANATPVNYDFTVTATSGPLIGTVSHGTFSYDSSSITPDVHNRAPDLLTALDFSWNGITFNASTANTGWLGFGANGQLTDFVIGTDCGAVVCTFGQDNDWLVDPGNFGFEYRLSDFLGTGSVTFSLASASAPEPRALGMFGFGVLLIGAFVGLRRRVA